MKIAIISDIHGNNIALQAVLKDIRNRNIEDIIFLGDSVFNGPQPKEVFKTLRQLSKLTWIKGNTDIWYSDMGQDFCPNNEKEHILYSRLKYGLDLLPNEYLTFTESLPEKVILNYEEIKFLCVHGSPRSINEVINPFDEKMMYQIIEGVNEDIILCGHSHRTFVKRVIDKLIVNPGSVGISMGENSDATYAVINVNGSDINVEIIRVKYEIDKIINLAKESNFPYIEKYLDLLMNVNI